MISKNFFKRAKNELEGVIRPQKSENERAITTGSRHGRELRFLRTAIPFRSATEI